MLCEKCGSANATVELKVAADGQSREIHLCERCAMDKGIDVPDLMSVTDLLAGLKSFGGTPSEQTEKECPSCGLTLKDLEKGSRLGCGECYEVFEPELQPILAEIHGSSRHVGRKPGVQTESPTDPELASEVLERKLESAVAAEDYEEAARLRDVLRVEEAGKDNP